MTQITVVQDTPSTSPEPDEHTDDSHDSDSGEIEFSPPVQTEALKRQALQTAFSHFADQSTERNKILEDKARSRSSFDESKKIIDKARGYQEELFQRAKAENVIAVLDTGSGKTLIACLLIRDMIKEESAARHTGSRPRIACFVVNSVHLVKQQSYVIEENLGHHHATHQREQEKGKSVVAMLHGGSKDDLTREGWRQRIKEQRIVVCTAEILNYCLSRSYVKMEDIFLLILDEAHHAKKEHPMARIMVDSYFPTEPSRRPKIFGMTASPVDTKRRDTVEALAALETVLNSRVVTTTDMTLLAHAPKAENQKWIYDRLRVPFETSLCSSLSQVCYIEELRDYFEFAKRASSELGSWMSDQIWQYALGSDREVTKTIKQFEQSSAYTQLSTTEQKQRAILRIRSVAEIVKRHFFEVPTASARHLSPKVDLLFRKLSATYATKPDTRSIIFVERRLTAQMLADFFRQINIPNVRPGVLIGVNKADLVVDRLVSAVNHQDGVMRSFRAGLINCVFATNVAEEGIDIPQCSLVVRFDLFKAPIQYMQSKGRARMGDSVYAMMMELGNRRHEIEVKYAVDMGDYIRDFCQKLPADRLLGGSGSAYTMLKTKEATKHVFKTVKGAVCHYHNSQDILSRYASSLQHTGVVNTEVVFDSVIDENNKDGQFKCRVQIGDSDIFTWGPACRSKSLAKKAAAWLACAKLRKNSLLDEELNSIHVRKRPENANAHLAVSAKKHQYAMKIKPDMWRQDWGVVPDTLHATLVTLAPTEPLEREHASLVLLTRQSLPEIPRFEVFLGKGEVPTGVIFSSVLRPLSLNSTQLDHLTAYTLDGIFADVFNKKYELDASRMSYWLAPAAAACCPGATKYGEVVDEVGLTSVESSRIKWIPGASLPCDWTYKFLIDPFSAKYHYFTGDTVSDATINASIPESARAVPKKGGSKDVFAFSDSRFRTSQLRSEHKRDPDQPVLLADLIMARRNFLDAGVSGTASSCLCHICPQLLEVSRLDTSVIATALVWPSIVHRLESYLIVSEAFEKLEVPGVPLDLALEAFTKDSNTDDQENQMHTGSLRGMGKNYERLEFIGDSLLKMTTTIMVYLRHINSDEMGLHCARMKMLCNLNLFNVSTGPLELFEYARTKSVDKDTWYPENLVLIQGHRAKMVPEPVKHDIASHDLGQKTIADISEAIIGAALMATKHQGYNTKFDLAIKAVTKLVESSNHTIRQWCDIAPLYIPPAWSLVQNDPIAKDTAQQVQQKTGYMFNHPRLLRSAFTHRSDQHSVVPCYEQLEFVGDAVLDMVCINWLFENHPDRNPQWLTEHKMAMVSNKFLAALAVDLGFDRHMVAQTPSLLSQINEYAAKVRGNLAKGKGNIRPDFWVDITNAPKALSDLVESYIGAVLIDSGFNYGKIEAFFTEHIHWYFQDITMYDSFANRHPTSYVHRKLTDEYKCAVFKVICSEHIPGAAEDSILAGVLIHGTVVASSNGSSARYAKLRASKQLLAKLDGLSIAQFREQYKCDCRRGADEHECLVEEEDEEIDEIN